MMKNIFYIAFLIGFLAFSSFLIYDKRENYASLYRALDPCKRPIEFRVDEVDPRFNLTREQVIQFSNEAAQIWNKGYGSEILKYSENGILAINMVYDSRQQTSNKITELDKNVGQEKNKLDSMIAEHITQVSNFKQRLAEHNRQVQQWNQRGGAPPEEYEKLTAEQKELEEQAKALNDQARNLNLATEDYNLQVGQLNEVISDFNDDLVKKPEEGLYLGDENKIEIYFNNNKEELIHTISHELGHARGVDHNNNPKSIMYPFSTSVLIMSVEDKNDLVEVCREKSPTEVIRNRLNF